MNNEILLPSSSFSPSSSCTLGQSKFTYLKGFLTLPPKYDTSTLSERRQLLFNKFLAKRDSIDSMLDEFIEFLDLEKLHTNETERHDLLEIADQLKLSLGCFDQVLDDIYALDYRLKEEALRQISDNLNIDLQESHEP